MDAFSRRSVAAFRSFSARKIGRFCCSSSSGAEAIVARFCFSFSSFSSLLFLLLLSTFYFSPESAFFFLRFWKTHKKERSKKRARTEYTRSRTEEEEEDVRIERERERRASLARESPFFLSFFFCYSIERDEKTRANPRSLIVKIWIRRLRI